MTLSRLQNVSRETEAGLIEFVGLVTTWTKRINLISPKDVGSIWERHVTDSLQLSAIAGDAGPHWLDVGTGGGFPGLVLAILNRDIRPEARHTFIESDHRKAAFLMTASHHLKLQTNVLACRSEDALPQSADVVTARAFAPLSQLLAHVVRHMSADGRAILPKGASVDVELTKAQEKWSFNLSRHPSQTSDQATILKITEVVRA